MRPKAPGALCDECPLKDQPHVLGAGPDKPKIAIVGEAPGAVEVRTGIPFMGKSGQLLNKMLEAHGFRREEIYVTNTVLCRPPENRNPTAKEVHCCHSRLFAELQERAPQAILALGAVASKSVLNSREGISSLRLGGAKYSEDLQTHVIPTFHPAAALYNPSLFPSIVSDIKKLKRPQAYIAFEPTKWAAVTDPEQATKALVAQIENRPTKLMTLDIETAKPYNRHSPNWLCIGISHRPGRAVVYDREVIMHWAFRNSLRTALHDRGIKWGMQFGKFDIQHLWEFAPEARVDEDSGLCHYATDERKGTHDLEQIGTEILGAPYWKSAAKALIAKEEDLSSLPKNLLYQYNAGDVDITHRLIETLHKEMEADEVTDLYYRILIPASNALAHMEYNGFRLDLDFLDKAEARLSKDYAHLESELNRYVANPRSPKQVLEVLDELGFDVPNTRKETLAGIEHEFTNEMLDFRKIHKELGTYVKGVRKRAIDGVVHPNFNVHGTETGRLSSSNPNLQNIPIGWLRGMFTARSEDHLLLNVDYSGIELRVFAYLKNDPWLQQAFAEGRNIHKETALDVFGEGYTEKQYISGKAVTFGILFDRREDAIAQQLLVDLGLAKLPPERKRKEYLRLKSLAKAIIRSWMVRCPTIPEYHAEIRKEIGEKSYLRSMFGRLRRFWLVTPENRLDTYREGYNFKIQGPASDITLLAYIDLQPKLVQFDAFPVNIVHDSLVIDTPKKHLEEVKAMTKEVMEGKGQEVLGGLKTPVEFKSGYRWGQYANNS